MLILLCRVVVFCVVSVGARVFVCFALCVDCVLEFGLLLTCFCCFVC